MSRGSIELSGVIRDLLNINTPDEECRLATVSGIVDNRGRIFVDGDSTPYSLMSCCRPVAAGDKVLVFSGKSGNIAFSGLRNDITRLFKRGTEGAAIAVLYDPAYTENWYTQQESNPLLHNDPAWLAYQAADFSVKKIGRWSPTLGEFINEFEVVFPDWYNHLKELHASGFMNQWRSETGSADIFNSAFKDKWFIHTKPLGLAYIDQDTFVVVVALSAYFYGHLNNDLAGWEPVYLQNDQCVVLVIKNGVASVVHTRQLWDTQSLSVLPAYARQLHRSDLGWLAGLPSNYWYQIQGVGGLLFADLGCRVNDDGSYTLSVVGSYTYRYATEDDYRCERDYVMVSTIVLNSDLTFGGYSGVSASNKFWAFDNYWNQLYWIGNCGGIPAVRGDYQDLYPPGLAYIPGTPALSALGAYDYDVVYGAGDRGWSYVDLPPTGIFGLKSYKICVAGAEWSATGNRGIIVDFGNLHVYSNVTDTSAFPAEHAQSMPMPTELRWITRVRRSENGVFVVAGATGNDYGEELPSDVLAAVVFDDESKAAYEVIGSLPTNIRCGTPPTQNRRGYEWSDDFQMSYFYAFNGGLTVPKDPPLWCLIPGEPIYTK